MLHSAIDNFQTLRERARGALGHGIKPLGYGLMLAALGGSPVLADDTEIFQTQLNVLQSQALRPNVLFVIDTSGSMLSAVLNTPFPYDPAITYGGTCATNRIYWSDDGTAPDCTTQQFFQASQFRCDAAADALNAGGGGVYQDRAARFQTATQDWRELGVTAAEQNPPHVECRADRGVHGETAASTELYIVTGQANPWQTSPTGETNWETTGDFYTLYSGNYLNYFNNPPAGDPTRLQIVQAATNQIIGANHRNILGGLMRFDTRTYCDLFLFGLCLETTQGNRGGPVTFPITDLSTDANKLALQTAVNALTGEGFTPLAETLYEAALYFRGAPPLFGSNPPTPNDIQSVASSISGGNYISPITLECQKNHIVFLTDGDPTYDADADAQIATLIGTGANMSDVTCAHVGFDGGDNCLDELAEFLAEEDHSGLTGIQTINLYTIGFLTNQTLLADAAAKGNGQYFTANNALELSEAFQVILADIQQQTSTFSAPSVSVNAFNRITNRDELFFSLFTPSNRARWPGNIKRYQLDCVTEDASNPGFCTDGDSDGFPDSPVIVDDNGNAAVDDATGFFKTNTRSVWTPASLGNDGGETEKGGAANVIGGVTPADDPPTRVVYTYTGGYTNSNGTFTPNGTDVLSNAVNAMAESNALVTEALFFPGGRVATDPTRDDLIKWTRGVDVLDADQDGSMTDARHQIGDALHSKPVLVTYGSTEANPDLTLYSINNDGNLHAIDVDDGTEVFTFVPPEQLERVPDLFLDQATSSGKNYGLDGPLTVWFNDKDGDGFLDAGSPDFETVYLFFGLRRGGSRYYAVDVTDRSNPELLWKIEGGVPGSDFAELGQTWSAPRKARVKINGTVTDVLVFAAGYDLGQDNAVTPVDDNIGRGIFMINANTGALIWHTGPTGSLPTPDLTFTEMTNSIPSDINIFDLTGDGLDDRIYVGDTRGQLWRFDINNENTGVSTLATGTVLAELQKETATSTPDALTNRRFFFRPDVTLAAPEDAQPFLAITIGSGYRSRPLNTVIKDRFYMIRDGQIGNIVDPANYPSTTITEEDLANITDDLTPSAATLFGTPADPTVGWYLELKDLAGNFIGEKVLADSLVFNNVVLFTTFTPPTNALTADCQPNLGDGRVFAVDLFDGSPVEDLDESGSDTNFTRTDRHIDLLRSGIPPNVVVLFSKMNGVVPVGFVATEQLKVSFTDAPVKTYWFQQEVQ